MENILILLLFVTTAIISLLILYVSAGTFRILTLPIIWFIVYFVCIYLRAPQIFFENGATNISYLGAVLSGLLLVPVGAVCANIFFCFRPRKEIKKYLSSPPRDTQKENTFRLVFFLTTTICLAIVLIYFIKIKISSGLPFWLLIKGLGSKQAILSRISLTSLFPNFSRYRFIFSVVIPLLSIIALIKMFASTKKKIFWRNTFIILITVPAMIYIFLGLKSYFIVLFFLVFFAVILVNPKLNMRRPLFLIILTALVALMVIYSLHIGLYKNPIFALSTLFKALSNRITYAYSNILYHIFKVFPSQHDYLYGSNFPNPGGIFPFKPFSLPSYMKSVMEPESSSAGTSPTVFTGGIYASFGFPGMLLSIPLVGFLLQAIQIYFIRRKKAVINVAFLVILGYYTIFIAISDIFSFISPLLIVLIAVIIFLKIGPIILYKTVK